MRTRRERLDGIASRFRSVPASGGDRSDQAEPAAARGGRATAAARCWCSPAPARARRGSSRSASPTCSRAASRPRRSARSRSPTRRPRRCASGSPRLLGDRQVAGQAHDGHVPRARPAGPARRSARRSACPAASRSTTRPTSSASCARSMRTVHDRRRRRSPLRRQGDPDPDLAGQERVRRAPTTTSANEADDYDAITEDVYPRTSDRSAPAPRSTSTT